MHFTNIFVLNRTTLNIQILFIEVTFIEFSITRKTNKIYKHFVTFIIKHMHVLGNIFDSGLLFQMKIDSCDSDYF